MKERVPEAPPYNPLEPPTPESGHAAAVVHSTSTGPELRPEDIPLAMGGDYKEVNLKIYKDGTKHVWGVNKDGKQVQLSHDDVLEYYGHAGDYQGMHPAKKSRQQPGGRELFSYEDDEVATGRKNLLHSLDPELAQELAIALNEYTKLAAARERSTLAPRLTRAKVEAARQRYEELRMKAKEWELGKMKDAELNLSAEDRVIISKLEDKTEAKMIALGIKFEAEALAEPKGFMKNSRRKFYDWWARQGGGEKFSGRLLGTTKKAAVMAGPGLVIGVGIGLAGAFLAPAVGGVVGGAIAVSAARGVARGLMRSHIEKSASAKSVAGKRYEQHLAAQYDRIENNHVVGDDGETHAPRYVTDVYAENTEKNVRRNRVRTAGSMAIGAAAGLGGAYLGELAHSAIWGGGHHPNTPPNPGTTHEPGSTTPVTPVEPGHSPHVPSQPPKAAPAPRPEHGITGQVFTVEHGSGEIREIQEYASSHNYRITPKQAYKIYTDLYAEHGSKIIDLAGSGPDTYVIHPGNVGLSHPGMANWYPGIEDELRDKLAKAAA
jgi:hypothetical protein